MRFILSRFFKSASEAVDRKNRISKATQTAEGKQLIIDLIVESGIMLPLPANTDATAASLLSARMDGRRDVIQIMVQNAKLSQDELVAKTIPMFYNQFEESKDEERASDYAMNEVNNAQ